MFCPVPSVLCVLSLLLCISLKWLATMLSLRGKLYVLVKQATWQPTRVLSSFNKSKVIFLPRYEPRCKFLRRYTDATTSHSIQAADAELYLNGKSWIFVEVMYDCWLENPKSVDKTWQAIFKVLSPGMKDTEVKSPIMTSGTDGALQLISPSSLIPEKYWPRGIGGSSRVIQTPRSRKHTVVIGGGYGGLLLAYLLQKKRLCKVTLIDPKDAMVHYVAALRSSVIPDYAPKMFIPYDQVMGGSSFVRGKVVRVDTKEKQVRLLTGEKIGYSELVIATGATSPFPGKIIDIKEDISAVEGIAKYREFYQEIAKSDNILIIGGGAVGLEMAGEIRTEFPNVQITIVNLFDYLISTRLDPSFQGKLADKLNKMGIKLILGDGVEDLDKLTMNVNKQQSIRTTQGRQFNFDLIIPCVGNRPLTQFLQGTLANSISKNGVISVDEKFKIRGFDDIYAIGDVTDINEEKMAYTAKLHAKHFVKNFALQLDGKPLKNYKPGTLTLVVPLGSTGGISVWKKIKFGPGGLGGQVTKYLKSRTLFTPQTWADVGLKSP